ncbi:MAG: oxygen-dependent coproporphyrinogen oxidase [Legionellales bacterium]|nr:oxygen-dependent coproporphyrinogen oxidase [Legionellales bacterium]
MLNQCQKLILKIQDQWHHAFQCHQSWQVEQLSPKEHYTNRILTTSGKVLEKGGIAMSQLRGQHLPESASLRYPKLKGKPFDVVGLSLVLHPMNPFVPSVHANLRFFQCDTTWWFGGGMDLSPYYPISTDCQHWHRTIKAACDQTDPEFYPNFKAWCDDYFYLKHRNHMRGIGGIFFDDLNEPNFNTLLNFTKTLGQCLIDAYLPILEDHQNDSYTQPEKDFQVHRRARYAEFNLLYDRGTLFGLQFGGRVESILMSMPPLAAWHYDWQPQPGSREAKLESFLMPQDWIS